ncbi:MAG: type II toxin-antitoxin system HicA family toxin [bacterium]
MTKLPLITGKEFIKFLESVGFKVTRKKGSHVRMRSDDGRVTTVPVHANKDLPKGLLRKIVREDLELNSDEFLKTYSKYKGKLKT